MGIATMNRPDLKWLTLENEDASRVLKQHGIIPRVCKDKFTGDPYPAI
jgi:hypothetical protein